MAPELDVPLHKATRRHWESVMTRILVVLVLVLLTACSDSGERITDFSTRATVYGWLEVDETRGDTLKSMVMRQYRPRSETPFFTMGLRKFEGGYLFWHHGLPSGRFEIDALRLQTCLSVICANGTEEFGFGQFGRGPGKVTVSRPSVRFVGNFRIVLQRSGPLQLSDVSVRPTRTGPSRAELLDALVTTAPRGHPIVAQRIVDAR